MTLPGWPRPLAGTTRRSAALPGGNRELLAGPGYGQGGLRGPDLGGRRVPLLVAAAHQRRGDHEISGGPVAGHRDIADHGDPEQGLNVRIMRMRLERIPQEYQQVDLALGDTGADLLVAAIRAAPEAGDGQAELLQEVTGGGRGEQVVTGQQAQVVLGPLEHVLLLVVVRDQGDASP